MLNIKAESRLEAIILDIWLYPKWVSHICTIGYLHWVRLRRNCVDATYQLDYRTFGSGRPQVLYPPLPSWTVPAQTLLSVILLNPQAGQLTMSTNSSRSIMNAMMGDNSWLAKLGVANCRCKSSIGFVFASNFDFAIYRQSVEVLNNLMSLSLPEGSRLMVEKIETKVEKTSGCLIVLFSAGQDGNRLAFYIC